MVSKKKMPPRRQQILEFVQEFYSQNGIPPTVRDIQKACELSSTSVVDYNAAGLRSLGYAEKRMGLSRNLHPTARVAFVTVDGETDVYELVPHAT